MKLTPRLTAKEAFEQATDEVFVTQYQLEKRLAAIDAIVEEAAGRGNHHLIPVPATLFDADGRLLTAYRASGYGVTFLTATGESLPNAVGAVFAYISFEPPVALAEANDALPELPMGPAQPDASTEGDDPDTDANPDASTAPNGDTPLADPTESGQPDESEPDSNAIKPGESESKPGGDESESGQPDTNASGTTNSDPDVAGDPSKAPKAARKPTK